MGGWTAWIRSRFWGLCVGAIVTLLTMALFVEGWLHSYSLLLLDFKFRQFNSLQADDSIVMIDIDDYALEYVHSWPWPRAYVGNLIRTLNELGARSVVMDLVFDAPTGGRIRHPELAPDADVDDPGDVVGEVRISDAIRDDEVLAKALEATPHVVIGMFGSVYPPRFPPERIREAANRILDAEPTMEAAEFLSRVEKSIGAPLEEAVSTGRAERRADPVALFNSIRTEFALERDFRLDVDGVAERLGAPVADIEKRFASAKRIASRRLIQRYLEASPEAVWGPKLFHQVMPGESFDKLTPDRKDLLRAYRAMVSEREVLDRAAPAPASLAGRLKHVTNLTPPLDMFVKAADAGLVIFQTDEDGVMRRVPLLVSARGKALKQLGFAAACDLFDIDESTMRLEDGQYLCMESRDGQRDWRIQIDDEGRTLINWHIDRTTPNWEESFEHLAAAALMQIPLLRQSLLDNEGLSVGYAAEFVELANLETPSVYADFQSLSRERVSLGQREVTDVDRERLAYLNREIERIENESIELVVDVIAPDIQKALEAEESLEGEENAPYRRMLELAQAHKESDPREEYARVSADLRENVAERLEMLRLLIEGKTCIVGYTASAVADTVNSSVFKEMPGSLAHANVLNSMALNRFPYLTPRWIHLLLILVGGAVVTVVTSWRDPWVSLLVLGLTTAVWLAIAFGLFYMDSTHVDVVGPLVAGVGAWAVVTLYRQLTEERHKRAFSRSLAQYTSPAIAAKLSAHVTQRSQAMDLSPQPREVTCFFSDLKGFTSISERLGASRTRELLNPYLEVMSEVLIETNGMINKFMGDGIFAFFNSPILEVKDHAGAACEATLKSFDALERLKDRLAHGELEWEVRSLSMRVGLNTGDVFVGDYGSLNKLDYTCIGDTVNLAARLEPACKAFGTQTLLSEWTRVAAGDRYEVRRLGGLQVVGKKQAVPIYELLGRKGEVDSATLAYAELFAEAVDKFERRDWEGSLRLLDRCLDMRPNDKAISLFVANIREFQFQPPPDDWNCAIELTSK